jgi:hypothetical protein
MREKIVLEIQKPWGKPFCAVRGFDSTPLIPPGFSPPIFHHREGFSDEKKTISQEVQQLTSGKHLFGKFVYSFNRSNITLVEVCSE